MYYIYYTAFKQYKYGYGNAMGVVLAVIIAILVGCSDSSWATRIIQRRCRTMSAMPLQKSKNR